MSALRRVSSSHCRNGRPARRVRPARGGAAVGAGRAPDALPSAAAMPAVPARIGRCRRAARRSPSRVPVPKCSAGRGGRAEERQPPPGRQHRDLVAPVRVRRVVRGQRPRWCPASASARSVRISSAPRAGSRPDVGSSRKNSAGPASSSDAIEARLRSPPDSSPTGTGDGRRARASAAPRRPPPPGTAAQRRGVAERAGQRQGEVDDVVLGDVADVAGRSGSPSRRPAAAGRTSCRAAWSCPTPLAADYRHQFPGPDGQRHVLQRDTPDLAC